MASNTGIPDARTPTYTTAESSHGNHSGTSVDTGGDNQEAGSTTDLHKFEIPPEHLAIPEFCFRVRIDFAKPFKTDENVVHLKRILTGLLNTSGGVLEIRSMADNPVEHKQLDAWKRNLEETLMSFIPHSIYRSSIRLIDYAYPIVIAVYKSTKLITLSSNMWIRGLASNRAVNDVDTIVDVTNQISEKQIYHPLQHAPSVCYGDDVSICEGPNVEYKYWQAVKSFDDPKQKNTYKARLQDDRTTRGLLAFPNMTAGGFLLLGIEEDKQRRKNVIRGQVISEPDEGQLTDFLIRFLEEDPQGRRRIWGAHSANGMPQYDRDWTIRFVPVTGGPPEDRRRVIIIHIGHYRGGVMSHCPESYHVTEEGHVNQISLSVWIERMGLSSQMPHMNSCHTFQRSCSYTQTEDGICTIANSSSQTDDDIRDIANCGDGQGDGTFLAHSDHYAGAAGENLDMPEESDTPRRLEMRNVNAALTESDVISSDPPIEADPSPDKGGIQTLSYTKHKENWRDILRVTSGSIEDNVQNFASNATIFRLESPMLLTPSRNTIISSQPRLSGAMRDALDDIQADNDMTVHGKSFGLAASKWTSNLCVSFTPTRPEHHILDILVVAETGRIKFWTVMDDRDFNLCEAWKYALISARLTKRSVLLPHLVNNEVPFLRSFHIECHVYRLNQGNQSHFLASVYQQAVGDILNAPIINMDDLKRCLAASLMKKGTHIANIFGDEYSILLTAEQMDLIMSIGFDRFNYIEGPPGSGKTYSALHLCQKHSNYGYVFSRPAFRNYLIHQGLEASRLFLSRTSGDIMQHLHRGAFDALEFLIIDDVQGVTFSKDAWQRLFAFILESTTTRLVVFGDSTYQRYMSSPAVCLKVMQDFCKQRNCHMTMKVLSQIHRNTKKVVSFIMSNFSNSETFPDHAMISCSHPEDGDDVEIIQLTDTFIDSDNNSLLNLVQNLTDPEANVSNKSKAYEPKDIAILLDTPHPQVDVDLLTSIFTKNVSAHITVNDASTFPVTGFTIDALDNFMGLDRRVCILITGTYILKSRDSSGRSITNPRYRTFAASRGIARVIFVVETKLNTTLASHFNLDNIMPFIKMIWHEDDGSPVNDLCIAHMDGRPVVVYIWDCSAIRAFDFEGNSILVEVDVQDMKKTDRIASSMDGKSVAVAGWDDQDEGPYWWTTYGVSHGKLTKIKTFGLNGRPWSVCWTHHNNVVVVLRDSVAMLSPSDGQVIWCYQESHLGIKSAHRVSSRGERIYIGDGRDNCVVQLSEDGVVQRRISAAGVSGNLWSLALDESERSMFVGSLDHTEVYLLGTDGGPSHKVIDAPDSAWELALHDDRYLAISSSKGCALYDVAGVL